MRFRISVALCLVAAVAPGILDWLAGGLSREQMVWVLCAAMATIVLLLATAVRTVGLGAKAQFGDIRAHLDREAANLGAVANAVAEIREAIAREQTNLSLTSRGVSEVRDQVEALASRLQDQADVLRQEQTNLGMVAGAVDELREYVFPRPWPLTVKR